MFNVEFSTGNGKRNVSGPFETRTGAERFTCSEAAAVIVHALAERNGHIQDPVSVSIEEIEDDEREGA